MILRQSKLGVFFAFDLIHDLFKFVQRVFLKSGNRLWLFLFDSDDLRATLITLARYAVFAGTCLSD